MTSNAPITAKVRQYLSEKYKGMFPPAPINSRRTECPDTIQDTQEKRAPNVRKVKQVAIGVHTVAQKPCRRAGGAKVPSTKIQPAGIISPVPYVAKTNVSVCTRKGNGLGNKGESFKTYEATKAKYIPKVKFKDLPPRKDYVVEETASVIVTPDEREANKASVRKALKAAKVDKAIKAEMKKSVVYTPTWSGPTGGEATTPRRDSKAVMKGPKTNNKSVGKRKNRNGYTKLPSARQLDIANARNAKTVTALDVRDTAQEKAVSKAERAAKLLVKQEWLLAARAEGMPHMKSLTAWKKHNSEVA